MIQENCKYQFTAQRQKEGEARHEDSAAFHTYKTTRGLDEEEMKNDQDPKDVRLGQD